VREAGEILTGLTRFTGLGEGRGILTGRHEIMKYKKGAVGRQDQITKWGE
jgi:hypothetical protein